MIVVAALLYGKGDFGKSICLAVESAFDTDCNGATVGSILGMALGFERIPPYWYQTFNNRLQTTIFGVETVDFSSCIAKTLRHIDWRIK
jgi:ADP-ribosylglycohydrolase